MQRKTCKITVGIFFLLATAFISCSREPTAANTLFAAIESVPKSRHPVFGNDANSTYINSLVYESLVSFGPDLSMIPSLATRWEQPRPEMYRFHLRPSWFHNGEPVTCEDIKTSVQRYAEPDCPLSSSFRRMKWIRCSSENTIEITLDAPFAGFLADLYLARVFPRSLLGDVQPQTRQVVGSGPYRYISGDLKEIRLQRFDRYAGQKPFLEHLVFKIMADPQTRFLALKRGDLDVVMNALLPQQMAVAESIPHLAIHSKPGISYQFVSINHRIPALQDKRVRQAFMYGFDRSSFVRYKLKGFASVATGFLPPLSWYNEAQVKTYAFEPETARKLMAEAGYTLENPLRLELKSSTDALSVSLALVLKEQLRQVGFDLRAKSLEWATFFSDISRGNFDLHISRWIGLVEPNAYYDFLHSSQFAPQGRNRGFFQNSRYDALTEKAMRETQPEKRKLIYTDVQKLFAEELPYFSLWHYSQTAVYQRHRLQGLEIPPNGGYECLLNVKKE